MLNLRLRLIVIVFGTALLFFPSVGYSKTFPDTRELMISQTLTSMEARDNSSAKRFKEISAQDQERLVLEESATHLYPKVPVQSKLNQSDSLKNMSNEFKSAFGDQTYMTLGLKSGYINGHTTFRIAFDNPYSVGGHGESELKWPLNNALAGIGTSFNYRLNKDVDDSRDRARVDFIWLTGLDENSGRMRDSDWIQNDVGYIDYYDDGSLNGSSAWATNHDGKDIYSETVSDVKDLNICDVNYIYNFWPNKNWAIGPRLGYRYQKINFYSHSLEQIGYGPYGSSGSYNQGYMDTKDRKWINYEAQYSIPYFGLSSEFNWKEKFSFLFNFGFSDWVRIEDQDTHLYPTFYETYGYTRNMVSKGHTEGQAYLSNIQGLWRLQKNWLLSLGVTWLDLDTKGYTIQRIYDAGALVSETSPIEHRVTSEYWLVDLSLRYNF